MWRQGMKFAIATVATLALFGLVSLGFDASAVRVFLGITPPLDVPYVGTRSAMVDAMLDMAEVGASDHVIDLGTGDGRILIAAARDRGASGLGVDLDPTLIDSATAEAAKLGLSDHLTFREQDLFETPLHEADVVTMFLLPSVNLRLRPRLLEQLRPGTRVVSNRFRMGDWRPDEVRRASGYPAYLWIVPAQIAGSWQLNFEGRSIPVELQQTFQQVDGTALINGEAGAISPVLKGDRLRFSIDLADGKRVFEGVVQGDRLLPTDGAEWIARRQAE